jgi:hypothetical protein
MRHSVRGARIERHTHTKSGKMSNLSIIFSVSVAVFFNAPAFAFSVAPSSDLTISGNVVKVACNPGTPNCIKVDPTRAKIQKGAANAINNPISQEQECKGGGRCGYDSGGSPAIAKGAGVNAPTQLSSKTGGGASGGGSHH